jgi:polyhydroxyalkanoate synthesis regulator phasin
MVEDEDDGEIFEENMKQLVSDLKGQIKEENRLNEEIRKQLKNVRFEI